MFIAHSDSSVLPPAVSYECRDHLCLSGFWSPGLRWPNLPDHWFTPPHPVFVLTFICFGGELGSENSFWESVLSFHHHGWYEWVWGPRKMTAPCRVFHERREVLLLQRKHSHVREREHSHVRRALGLYFECRGVLRLSRAGQSTASRSYNLGEQDAILHTCFY